MATVPGTIRVDSVGCSWQTLYVSDKELCLNNCVLLLNFICFVVADL